MIVFAHRPFRYTLASTGQEFIWGPDHAHDVPDDHAEYIVRSHPDNLCALTVDERPVLHKCSLTPKVRKERVIAVEQKAAHEAENVMIEEPLHDRMMRMAPGRRKRYKRVLRRSIRARREAHSVPA